MAGAACAVVDLSADNFAKAVAATKTSGETLIVDLYAPWCGHCQRFAPVFEKVASEHPSGVTWSKIDADANGKAVEAVQAFSGFPTIWKISKGSITEFEGDYTNEATFLAWATGATQRFRAQAPSESKTSHHARAAGAFCARHQEKH